METDLPALCLRVWGKVPEVRPQNNEWQMEDHFQITSKYDGMQYSHAFSCQEHLIQAACLRWLLTQEHVYIYPPTEKGYFIGADSNAAWSVMDKDLTTCLLLAVERCHEYKENKE